MEKPYQTKPNSKNSNQKTFILSVRPNCLSKPNLTKPNLTKPEKFARAAQLLYRPVLV